MDLMEGRLVCVASIILCNILGLQRIENSQEADGIGESGVVNCMEMGFSSRSKK